MKTIQENLKLFYIGLKDKEPFFYKNKAGETVYGAQILANKLEMSNVDLGQALSEVIVTQKAYEASAKSITTSDEMIQTAIQMKK